MLEAVVRPAALSRMQVGIAFGSLCSWPAMLWYLGGEWEWVCIVCFIFELIRFGASAYLHSQAAIEQTDQYWNPLWLLLSLAYAGNIFYCVLAILAVCSCEHTFSRGSQCQSLWGACCALCLINSVSSCLGYGALGLAWPLSVAGIQFQSQVTAGSCPAGVDLTDGDTCVIDRVRVHCGHVLQTVCVDPRLAMSSSCPFGFRANPDDQSLCTKFCSRLLQKQVVAGYPTKFVVEETHHLNIEACEVI
eukprot:CAMPEP_0194492988 /NCGR_PEP_ID=MMETSP0253-20130528/11348_1 /TAXON_ID=2966 /ORGANISM="Noctiluca scintillans" /LENGTH=246 /DNA_ID=CAMNT_0039333921 /DNA_START=91 /DNA_END=831 /DNA_ORIENTATION=-